MTIDNQDSFDLPVIIRRGNTWARTLTISKIVNGVKTPTDVSLYTFELKIILIGGGEIDVPVTKITPLSGVIGWDLSPESSALIPAKKHSWKLTITNDAGEKRDYVNGVFEVI